MKIIDVHAFARLHVKTSDFLWHFVSREEEEKKSLLFTPDFFVSRVRPAAWTDPPHPPPWLLDGTIFSYQKSKFWYLLEWKLWSISRTFGIF
jgi:hypothetical protein